MALLDRYYYGQWVIASINIVLYNVFSTNGPDLYGTEPLSYYLINLFLNFNVAFLLSLLALPLSVSLLRTFSNEKLNDLNLVPDSIVFCLQKEWNLPPTAHNIILVTLVRSILQPTTQGRTFHVSSLSACLPDCCHFFGSLGSFVLKFAWRFSEIDISSACKVGLDCLRCPVRFTNTCRADW